MKKPLLLLLIWLYTLTSFSQTVGVIQHDSGSLDSGYVLFAPINSYTSYLIDKCGKQVKSWTSTYKPGQSVYLLDDGSLLHSGNSNNTTFNAGGKGGVIEKIDWDGNVTWSYTISNATNCQHHDIRALPNGNILAIVWDKKTVEQAIAQGRNPNLIATSVWSEKIIEIQPFGTNGGNIVWEWNLWDHLVQDYDPSKPNYGVISSNPLLIDLNYAATANTEDWQHINSIDYNPSLDQILISSHNSDEIWIIDHSTTTQEAKTILGGNSQKGGGILYRWGNPQSYDNGTVKDQKLFGQHNAQWISKGLPFENKIMIFNNGNGRTGGNYSTIEIIEPPLNGFSYNSSLPYLPPYSSWNYNKNNTNNWYAQNISGAQQLSNGNVLICSGPTGTFYEVDTNGETIWKYINPVNNIGIINQDDSPSQNTVFRASFYSKDFIGFKDKTLISGNTIENSNSLSNYCSANLSLVDDSLANGIFIYQNPAKEDINISILDFDTSPVTIEIVNMLGQNVFKQIYNSKQVTISSNSFSDGLYLMKISNKLSSKVVKIIINN